MLLVMDTEQTQDKDQKPANNITNPQDTYTLPPADFKEALKAQLWRPDAIRGKLYQWDKIIALFSMEGLNTKEFSEKYQINRQRLLSKLSDYNRRLKALTQEATSRAAERTTEALAEQITQANIRHIRAARLLQKKGTSALKETELEYPRDIIDAIKTGIDIERDVLMPKGEDNNIRIIFTNDIKIPGPSATDIQAQLLPDSEQVEQPFSPTGQDTDSIAPGQDRPALPGQLEGHAPFEGGVGLQRDPPPRDFIKTDKGDPVPDFGQAENKGDDVLVIDWGQT